MTPEAGARAVDAPLRPPTSQAAFRRDRVVRWSDCDAAGAVFHPRYLVIFDELFEEWMAESLRLDPRDLLLDRRIGLAVVQISVDFLAPSWLGDRVGLELAVERIGAKSMQLAFACRGASGELRLSMRQTRVAMCLRRHAGIDLPPDLRSALAPR